MKPFFGGADFREVYARTGAALEDMAFLDVPVEDGVHVVVNGQDETVVYPDPVAQVLSALGLDVVDIHFPELLNTGNFKDLCVSGWLTCNREALLEPFGLNRVNKPDLVGKQAPIALATNGK